MASKKEIFIRLKSVKNTKKITYAMKLVSAAKLKKAQDAVTKSRSYSEGLLDLINLLNEVSKGQTLSSPLMEERKVKNIAVVVVGGARGLAGGYNTNLHKKFESFVNSIKQENLAQSTNIKIVSYVLGKKPAEYLKRFGHKTNMSFDNLPEDAAKWPINEIATDIEQKFLKEEFDAVYIVYTKFKSALSVTPTVQKLLPVDPNSLKSAAKSSKSKNRGKVVFEPSTQSVFDSVIPQIFRALIMQACLDSKASEQGSRMAAMDSATKNAGDLIYKLQLSYNKLRQSGITSELLDIIGGSEAIS